MNRKKLSCNRTFFTVFFAVVIVMCVYASCNAQDRQADLDRLIEKQNWKRAYPIAKDILTKTQNVDINYKFGVICNQLGYYKEAVDPLRDVVEQEPDFAEGYEQLATAYRNLNEDEKALEIINYGLNVFPQNHNLVFQAGTVMLKMGKFDEAISYFKRFIDIVPFREYEGLFMIGLAHKLQGNIDQASAYFKQVMTLQPEYAPAYYEMAMLYIGLKSFDNAAYYLEQSLRYDPENIGAYFQLGVIYARQQKWDRAIEHFKAVIARNPSLEDAYLNLAQAYIQSDRPNMALMTIQLAFQSIDPTPALWLNRGVACGMKNLDDEEIESYRQALDLEPDYLPAHYNLALIYKKLGQYDKAFKHFEIMLKSYPNDKDILSHIAQIHSARGEIEQALKICGRIEDIDPEMAQSLREQIQKPGQR